MSVGGDVGVGNGQVAEEGTQATGQSGGAAAQEGDRGATTESKPATDGAAAQTGDGGADAAAGVPAHDKVPNGDGANGGTRDDVSPVPDRGAADGGAAGDGQAAAAGAGGSGGSAGGARWTAPESTSPQARLIAGKLRAKLVGGATLLDEQVKWLRSYEGGRFWPTDDKPQPNPEKKEDGKKHDTVNLPTGKEGPSAAKVVAVQLDPAQLAQKWGQAMGACVNIAHRKFNAPDLHEMVPVVEFVTGQAALFLILDNMKKLEKIKPTGKTAFLVATAPAIYLGGAATVDFFMKKAEKSAKEKETQKIKAEEKKPEEEAKPETKPTEQPKPARPGYKIGG